MGNMERHVVSGVRGKRPYTAALVDHIARIGCAARAVGARAPLAYIISMAKDRQLCPVQKAHKQIFNMTID